MENDTFLKSFKKSVNNSELNPYGYTRIHVNSDGLAAGTNILIIQTVQAGDYVELVNTDAVLSNGSKKYTFPTFPIYGETPANLFPINVGEYDVIIPKYTLRGINDKGFKKCTFDLSSLKYSKELRILHLSGENITGNLTDIPSDAALTSVNIIIAKIRGDINSIVTQIINGFKYIEEIGLSTYVQLSMAGTIIEGSAKTFLDTIANALDQSHELKWNIFASNVNIDNTTLNKSTPGTNTVTFDGNGGYSISFA